MKNKVSDTILLNILFPFIGSIVAFPAVIFGSNVWLGVIVVSLVTLLLTLLKSKSLDFENTLKINLIILGTLSLLFSALMLFTGGHTSGVVMVNASWCLFPYFPLALFANMMDKTIVIYVSVLLTLFIQTLFLLIKTKVSAKKCLALISAALLLTTANGALYLNRPAARYAGHGFKYMHGLSSTDLTSYTVYAETSKLAVLDHKASFIIENEKDMPTLDGAEACYPLYAAIAKAVYKDIDIIEKNALNTDFDVRNGKIVSFSNTIRGFSRLVDYNQQDEYLNRADMFFGAYPSGMQLYAAQERGVALNITPIGKEAFVFFVEKDNPIDSISAEDLRAIYHGDITNWSQLGGKNQEIVAFQRPANSGSQTIMEQFMGDVSLKEPKSYEKVDAMMGVIKKVAEYASEKGAIGYSFRYFLEELGQEKGVKMLAVDGVYPTIENIENGSYPLTTDLCLTTRKKETNPNVQKMIEFILSDEGQELVRKTGYAGLTGN